MANVWRCRGCFPPYLTAVATTQATYLPRLLCLYSEAERLERLLDGLPANAGKAE
jgi:hypothetical protein